MSSERTFTIESSEVKAKGGRFKAASPAAAAKKAARKLLKNRKCKRVVKFVLRETTRGSDGATFEYKGKKEKLDKPVVIKRGDLEIVYEYSYSVEAL
jgi:malate/lactate dehydrogenase